MNSGRIECNTQQCPHKYHYSTTNMKLVHGGIVCHYGEKLHKKLKSYDQNKHGLVNRMRNIFK